MNEPYKIELMTRVIDRVELPPFSRAPTDFVDGRRNWLRDQLAKDSKWLLSMIPTDISKHITMAVMWMPDFEPECYDNIVLELDYNIWNPRTKKFFKKRIPLFFYVYDSHMIVDDESYPGNDLAAMYHPRHVAKCFRKWFTTDPRKTMAGLLSNKERECLKK